MSEPLLSAVLQVLIQRITSPDVIGYFEGRKLSQRHFKKLDTAILSCNRVVDDAVEKQLSQPSVKKWLEELKDAVFEAEDLLDEIAFRNLQSKLEAGSSSRKLHDFISTYSPLKKGIPEMLKEILKRLHFLVKQKDALGLREIKSEYSSSLKIPTTSVIDESSCYGRDGDKESIVHQLTMDDANGDALGVIPIVGMGGIGKTALAQVVYNDTRVQEWFARKAWVFVSEEFDVFKITRDILKEVSVEVNCEAKTHNQIQLELKQKLEGRRFLIVLDNIWNENYADWDFLRRPLKSGATGSKIVVTTRNETVASIMRTVPSHRLTELSDEDCWFLFAKHAFGHEKSTASPELVAIGRELVKKCNGLPLAAKALGGLLHCSRNAKDWQKILDDNMWGFTTDSILPALKRSYDHLPANLKRCFVFCAIFPKNYQFDKAELILLWMAQDYLVESKGNKSMEEVGNDYFDEFVSRSFFQQSRIHLSRFTMHDLINDLAKFIAGEVCATLKDDGSSMIPKMTRHLSYARSEYDPSHKFDCIKQAEFLRTFLPLNPVGHSTYHTDSEIAYHFIPKLRRLRALSLSQYADIHELPDSFTSLKHLRYLNLQGTSVRRLPQFVSKLYNLQTLILHGCKDLKELPTDLAMLINLCHLDIRETQLEEMPSNFGKLIKLQILTDFFQGNQSFSSSSIEELGKLQNLCGYICIWNLQRVKDVQDASEANLKGKKHLKGLKLRWDSDMHDPKHSGVLERLQPHENIERFSIVGYGGKKFPDWVGDSCFLNIVSMSLIECKYCSSLPPLGQLASLEDLYIAGFDGIITIGLDLYGCRTSMNKPFPSLKILRFERMLQWKEWSSPETEAFPLLRELYIKECPNLAIAPLSCLPCLSRIEIEECQQFVASFPDAPSISIIKLKDSSRDVQSRKLSSGLCDIKVCRFHLSGSLQERIEQMGYVLTSLVDIELNKCDSLESLFFDVFPCLKRIRISRCSHLKSLDMSFQDFKSLRVLEIKKCPDLESLPSNLWASNLSRLRVQGCPNMRWLPEHMEILLPSLVDLQIGHCPQVGVRRLKQSLPSDLESIAIWDCSKLMLQLMQGYLLLPNSVSSFHAGIYDAIESFPEEKLLLPSSLNSLKIRSLENLKSLDYEQLQRLTSLEELTIINCPLLQFTPGESLPSTLACLAICQLQNIATLDDLGLSNLRRLKELTVIDCPNVEAMPEEGLPSSLSTISIWNCPLLEQRCQKETGADWSKISHIPRINIYVHRIQ